MAKAIWNNQIIADSKETIIVEGNHYFPVSAVNKSYLSDSTHQTSCPWKGMASYYSLIVDGKENTNAAWYYANPFEAAKEIRDHIAFWKGVQIEE